MRHRKKRAFLETGYEKSSFRGGGSDIEFSSQSLELTHFHGINLKPHRHLKDLRAQALADRSLIRLQGKDIQRGVDDFLAAMALNRLQLFALRQRLELAGVPIPDRLQEELLKPVPGIETDSM